MSENIVILVVDDDATIRASLADVLALQGFQVEAAENGADALALIEDRKPDLILADIMMPMMNGYQLYQRVRANPELNWIPFIFLTAKGDAEDIRFAKELGADDYLMKPIDVEDLIAAVYGRLKRFDDLQESLPSGRQQYDPTGAGVDEVVQTFSLTPRERDVLLYMIAGKSNAEIANELVVGIATVKSHVSSILAKLGARTRSEVVSRVLNPNQPDSD